MKKIKLFKYQFSSSIAVCCWLFCKQHDFFQFVYRKFKSTSTAESTTASSVDLNALELPQLTKDVAENEDLVEMVTNKGTIKIKLFPEHAPKAVENFMTHAKDGYYNGLTFHRVIKDFMIQGGDPKGDGTGGESIWGEGFETEINNHLYNIRGALSMARSQDPNSNGSQFFIVQIQMICMMVF